MLELWVIWRLHAPPRHVMEEDRNFLPDIHAYCSHCQNAWKSRLCLTLAAFFCRSVTVQLNTDNSFLLLTNVKHPRSTPKKSNISGKEMFCAVMCLCPWDWIRENYVGRYGERGFWGPISRSFQQLFSSHTRIIVQYTEKSLSFYL